MIVMLKHNDPMIAARINQLQQESYAVEAKLIGYDGIPYLLQGVEEIISSRETFIGYQIADELAGVTSYEKEDPESITICRMIISPAFFRRGIAKKLLNVLWHQEPGVRCIYVQTAAKNIPAINLYTKSGFHLIREFSVPDGLKLVRFRKIIGQ
jgi:ribosomal protein S18 acetylase RimI-like enzyme